MPWTVFVSKTCWLQLGIVTAKTKAEAVAKAKAQFGDCYVRQWLYYF